MGVTKTKEDTYRLAEFDAANPDQPSAPFAVNQALAGVSRARSPLDEYDDDDDVASKRSLFFPVANCAYHRVNEDPPCADRAQVERPTNG